jgi:hypothetical protein
MKTKKIIGRMLLVLEEDCGVSRERINWIIIGDALYDKPKRKVKKKCRNDEEKYLVKHFN